MMRFRFVLGLIIGGEIVSAHAQHSQRAEDYARERSRQLEEFNEDQVVESHANTQVIPPNIPKSHQEATDRLLNTGSFTGTFPTPPAENVSPNTTSTEKRSYWHRLSKVYGCFLEFLSGVLAAREVRDTQVVACTVEGNQTCANESQAKNNKKVLSLGERFNICLDEP